MMIREVEMKNIRSYDHARIEFPEGTTLFEGDIGSGKTSILMAIEFALFGNSTRDFYEKLLRKGSREGFVRVKFLINGEEYELYRSLVKRGKSIRNEESYVIDSHGRKKLLTSDEIRKYVLRLMGMEIREKKKKSLPVVTYAIYTPQETMKSILEGKDEERLEVIRKIFKLDEYRVARSNVDVLVSNIDSEIKLARELAEEMDRIRDEIDQLREDMKKLEDEKEKLERERKEKTKKMESARKNYDLWEDKRKRYQDIEKIIAGFQASLKKDEEELKRWTAEMQEIKKAREEMEELQKDANKYETLRKEVDELRIQLKELQEMEKNYARLEERIKRYEKDIEESKEVERKIKELERKLPDIESRLKEIGNLDAIREDLERKSREIYGKMRTLREKIGEKEEERENLRSIKAVCPTCRRPLSNEEKEKLLERNESELSELRGKMEEIERELKDLEARREKLRNDEKNLKRLEMERARIEEKISTLKSQLEGVEEERKDVEELKNRRDEIKRYVEEMEKIRDRYESSLNEMKSLEGIWRKYIRLKERVEREEKVRKRVKDLEQEIAELNEKIMEKGKEMKNLGYSEEEYEKVKGKYQNLRVEVARIQEAIKGVEEQLRRAKEIIEEREEYLSRLEEKVENAKKMEEIRNWLDEKFRPALEDIERMRLAAINEEFRVLFEEWFNELLGESDYGATVDENFKPIVRYENYDMPLGTLSGGERTSVALSYRLALNNMVKKALGLKTNLLILDEPTDGFSKDQLYKLKDILDKMETDQIIIVSHEKELRNVADTVFRVEKASGKSSVRKIV